MKTATKPSTLELCALGMNELNKYILDTLPTIITALAQAEGVNKLFLADGSRSKKFTDLVKLPEQVSEKKEDYFLLCQSYFDPTKYSFWIKYKICINGGSYDNNTAWCEYFEQSIYLCEIANQTITKIKPFEDILKEYNIHTAHTAEKFNKQIQAFEVANDSAKKLYNIIPEQVRAKAYVRK